VVAYQGCVLPGVWQRQRQGSCHSLADSSEPCDDNSMVDDPWLQGNLVGKCLAPSITPVWQSALRNASCHKSDRPPSSWISQMHLDTGVASFQLSSCWMHLALEGSKAVEETKLAWMKIDCRFIWFLALLHPKAACQHTKLILISSVGSSNAIFFRLFDTKATP